MMADSTLIVARLSPVATACRAISHADAATIALTLAVQGSSDVSSIDAAVLVPALCAAAATCAPATPAAPPTDTALLWTISAALDAALRALEPAQTATYIDAAIKAAYLPLLDPSAGLRAGQIEEAQAAAVAAIARAGDAGWDLAVELIRGAYDAGAGAVRLAAALLEAALAAPGNAAAPVLRCAADEAFAAALDALATTSAAKPTPTVAAIGQTLLPACLAAAQRVGRLSACLAQLWAVCVRLGASDSPDDRRTGLALLVQFCKPLLTHGGAAGDPALWTLLLRELGADQGLNRKRALHVLELALAHLQEHGNGVNGYTDSSNSGGVPDAMNAAAWIAFIRLYTTVEDTSMHLFKEAWPEVDKIHAPADGSSGGDGPCGSAALALPLPWVSLLWSKALCHRHVSAQKLAAVSFLRRAWPPAVLAVLPTSFASEVLIPALGQPSMQRGEFAEELISGGPRFFGAWAAALPQTGRAELLAALLAALAGKQQQQGVVLLASRALAATAASAAPLDPQHQAALLAGAAAAAAAQPGFGANAVAMKVYLSLVSAAFECIDIDSVATLEAVAAWLAAIPIPLLQPGGLTHSVLTAWLSEPRHANLGNILRQMVHNHMDSVGSGGDKAGPSARQVAAAALAVGEALGSAALEASLAPWIEAMEEDGKTADAALPLLTALVAAATPLPGAAAAPAARSALGDLLRSVFQRFTRPICAAADAHAAWLLAQVAPTAIAELGAAINRGCAEAGVSAGAAYNKDAVLPSWFLGPRNAACDALAAMAGGATLMGAVDSPDAAEAHQTLVSRAKTIVDDFTTAYLTLFSPSESQNGATDGTAGIASRVPLEVSIALLRPLSACIQVQFPSGEPVVGVDRAEQLIYGLLRGLEVAGTTRPSSPASSSVNSKGGRKKKASTKLEPLTLHSWHHLLTWRVLDGALAARGVAAALPPPAQAAALAAAAVSLALVPDGSNGPLHYIRCIRALLPALVAAPAAVAPPFLTHCRALAEAASSDALDPSNIPESTENLDAAVSWLGGVLISALTTNARRRARTAAGVLSCALHPCLFDSRLQGISTEESLALHGPGGVVRGVVEGIKAAGGRHSRLLIMFSTQLAALLAAFPTLGPCYTDFLVDWSLTGFEDETALVSLSDVALDEPTVAELTALLEPLDAELAKAHAASFAAPRVGTLCLLHAWVIEEAPGAAAAWDALLALALDDAELSSARYLHNGATHRKKIRVWQALAVLAPSVPQAAAGATLDRLVEALDTTNAATVKQYQETAALVMLDKAPGLLEASVLPRLEDYTQQRVEAMPSLITLAAVAGIRASRAAGEGDTAVRTLLRRAVSAILPWAGSFVHGNRSFAQLVLWRLGELFPWLEDEDPTFAAFGRFFESNGDLIRLRAAMGVAKGLDGFDLERAISPRGVLCEEAALLGTSQTGGPLEGAPAPLMEALSEYLVGERLALRENLAATMAENALVDQRRRGGGASNGIGAEGMGPRTESTLGEVYQRKITPSDKEAAVTDPWGAALGLAALAEAPAASAEVAAAEDESDPLRRAVDEAAAAARSGARQELIVVASLVDRLPNLAGLARTCEVFRASRLVLADAGVTKDPQFTSISVSAEHWVPIEEVSPIALEPWLRRKAAEGFTLVGLEQTAESARLHDYAFPTKTVLLLGAEREGVPADLLRLLDVTVEIPQLGVVRSLNVHVSAAIGIYEFTRQRLAAAAARVLANSGV